MKATRERRPGELTFSLAMLAAALFVLYQAYLIAGFSSPSSPGVFPMLAAAAMVVSGLVIAVDTGRMKRGFSQAAAGFLSEITPATWLVFTAMIVAYMLALKPLGFLVSSFLFLFAALIYLHRRGIVWALVLSAGSLAAIYVIFRHVFAVVLPEGALFR